MGPFEVNAKPGTVGRVAERALLAWIAVSVVVLLAVHLVTRSDVLQVLALVVLVLVWRRMQRRAATIAVLPPYPDPPPSFHPLAWQRWGWLPGCAALGAVLGELGYRLGGGPAFWGFVGFLAPMAFVLNRCGVERRPKHLGELASAAIATSKRPGRIEVASATAGTDEISNVDSLA